MIIEKIAQTGTTDSNYTLGKVLWENQSPNTSFASQTIELSSDDYDYYGIEYKATATGDTVFLANSALKGYGTRLTDVWTNQFVKCRWRSVEITDNTHFLISNCSETTSTTSQTEDNTSLIPLRVIGYKNTIPTVVQKEVESGSNENGDYVKYSDGTMICYGSVSENVTFTASGNMYIGNLNVNQNFPVEFKDKPILTMTVDSGTTAIMGTVSYDKTKVNSLNVFRPTASTGTVIVNYIAIGKWK